jgi:hypothetical protein
MQLYLLFSLFAVEEEEEEEEVIYLHHLQYVYFIFLVKFYILIFRFCQIYMLLYWLLHHLHLQSFLCHSIYLYLQYVFSFF